MSEGAAGLDFLTKYESGRELPTSVNSPEAIEEHKRITGGKLRFRFPPEPNGYLHVGHAKSCWINFGGAKKAGGECWLRYDDTNPDAENMEYVDSIRNMVEWLGWEPARITFSSQYFDTLYELAERLINEGNAYVDESTKADISKQKETCTPSPYRDRPREESLRLFRAMRRGMYPEGKIVLRLRVGNDGYKDVNPNMRDPIAYRVKYTGHALLGEGNENKWCVYPTYDYTHCLVDSLEHMDYSICTLEFETRRESYFWLLHVLDMWKPHVFEFGRLQIKDALLSKRNIKALVDKGLLRGWDDPRLLTLAGMRRRGFVPAAITSLVEDVGVSRSADSVIDQKKVEHHLRNVLNNIAPRAFGLLKPLLVRLTNVSAAAGETAPGTEWSKTYTAQNHPTDESFGTREMSLYETLYIDHSDFRTEDAKGYWGLAPGKLVGLKYGPMMRCVKHITDARGEVVELECEVVEELPEGESKPKGWLQWISFARGDVPPYCEVRVYKPLFKPDTEGQAPDERFDPASEEIIERAMAEPHVLKSAPLTTFQFERVGFFTVDVTSTPARPIINRTISLKEQDWEAKTAPAAAAAGKGGKGAKEAEANPRGGRVKDPEAEAKKQAKKEAQAAKRAAAKAAWLASGGQPTKGGEKDEKDEE